MAFVHYLAGDADGVPVVVVDVVDYGVQADRQTGYPQLSVPRHVTPRRPPQGHYFNDAPFWHRSSKSISRQPLATLRCRQRRRARLSAGSESATATMLSAARSMFD